MGTVDSSSRVFLSGTEHSSSYEILPLSPADLNLPSNYLPSPAVLTVWFANYRHWGRRWFDWSFFFTFHPPARNPLPCRYEPEADDCCDHRILEYRVEMVGGMGLEEGVEAQDASKWLA